MRELYTKYKKQFDGCISATKIYIGFIFFLEFIIKGAVDLHTSGHYFLLSYIPKSSVKILCGYLFFAVMLLIDCLIASKKRRL